MIYLFLADGFEEIEALTPVDVIRRAGIQITTVAVGNSRIVTGAHGISVVADVSEDELNDSEPEAIILPGGMPGTVNLDNSDIVHSVLDNAIKNNVLVCAICAAPSILGNAGYLKGKKVTCFPGFENEPEATYTGERVCVDGNIITSKGMGCAAEFAYAIIEKLLGKEKADSVASSAFII